MAESKAQYATSVTADLEIAMINAAAMMTVEAVGKTSADMLKRYKAFYTPIVEAYNHVH